LSEGGDQLLIYDFIASDTIGRQFQIEQLRHLLQNLVDFEYLVSIPTTVTVIVATAISVWLAGFHEQCLSQLKDIDDQSFKVSVQVVVLILLLLTPTLQFGVDSLLSCANKTVK